MNHEKNERLQVRVTSQLKNDATRAAKRRGMSLSAVVSNLLTQFIEAERAQRKGSETESI